jgi:hypothetical protein
LGIESSSICAASPVTHLKCGTYGNMGIFQNNAREFHAGLKTGWASILFSIRLMQGSMWFVVMIKFKE